MAKHHLIGTALTDELVEDVVDRECLDLLGEIRGPDKSERVPDSSVLMKSQLV
jgi:hypothetical protein